VTAVIRRCARIVVASILASLASNSAVVAQDASPQIVVAGAPNDSGGAIFYAQDLGMFKKAGLNVKIQAMNNPGSIAAAVVGGSVTIGTLTIPGIAIAREKGIPIVIIAPGPIYSSATPTSGIIVLKNSPFKKAADLNGKTIATRDLSNLSYYGGNNWIDKNGGDSKTIKWVEITDTQTVPALLAGRIDAASVSEPALDDAVHGGDARLFAAVYDAIGDKFLIGGNFTTEAYAKAHPEVVRAFERVIIEASKWANRNRSLSAKILEKYAGVPVPPSATRVTYSERLRAADAQPVLDMLRAAGVLKTPLQAADLFAPGLTTP
jgi:NitT/TauT family transport system substrate-binding protein